MTNPSARNLAAKAVRLTESALNGLGARVGVFGDSLSAGNDMWGDRNPAYADRFAHEAIGPIRMLNWLTGQRFEFPVDYNFGKGGEKTGDMLLRLDAVMAARLSLCFFMGGTNDLAGELTFDADETLANIKKIVNTLTGAGTVVVLQAITPRQSWGQLTDTTVVLRQRQRVWLNHQLRQWSAARPLVLFVDYENLLAKHSSHYGALQASTATVATLAADASSEDDAYRYHWLQLYSSTALGARRMIIDYDGTTKAATLLGSAWPTTGSISMSVIANNYIVRHDGGSFINDGFTNGQAINLSGFTGSGNNAARTLTAVYEDRLLASGTLNTEAAASGKTVTSSSTGSGTTYFIDPKGQADADKLFDGLHLSHTSALLMGRELKRRLEHMVPARDVLPLSSGHRYHPTYDPNGNILFNGCFQGAGGTASPATGDIARPWRIVAGATYSSTQTMTVSKEVGADGFERQVFAISAMTGGADQQKYYLRQTVVPSDITYEPGDRLYAVIQLELSNIANVNSITLQCQWTDNAAGDNFVVMDGRNQNISDGVDGPSLNEFPATLTDTLVLKTPIATVGDFTAYSGTKQLLFQVEININAAAGTDASLTLKASRAAVFKA